MSIGTKLFDGVMLITEECYKCGVTFAFPVEIYERCHRDHERSFYCPNGHGQVYTGKTSEQKLKERLEQEARRNQELENRAGRISKNYMRMRKRVANGVCPCCNRTFQNLFRHMKSEHPDFAERKVLKTMRLAFGLTQNDLAKEVGVGVHHVSMYENNKSAPEYAIECINHWIAEQAS